jgi:hypothetical protein
MIDRVDIEAFASIMEATGSCGRRPKPCAAGCSTAVGQAPFAALRVRAWGWRTEWIGSAPMVAAPWLAIVATGTGVGRGER